MCAMKRIRRTLTRSLNKSFNELWTKKMHLHFQRTQNRFINTVETKTPFIHNIVYDLVRIFQQNHCYELIIKMIIMCLSFVLLLFSVYWCNPLWLIVCLNSFILLLEEFHRMERNTLTCCKIATCVGQWFSIIEYSECLDLVASSRRQIAYIVLQLIGLDWNGTIRNETIR